MASRILDESRAGEKASTDILSGGIDHMLRLIKAKALQPVEWSKYFPAMTGERVEFNGQIVSYYTQFYGVLYNTKRVPSQALPRRMNDLLNAKWKGTMATPPYAGVPARAIVGIKDLSIERMKKFFQSYMPLVGGFIRCGEEERIASGEFNLFFPACDILSAMISAKRKAMPVGGVVLEDFAALEYKYWAIPKTSANPNLAKLWAAFALSPEGNRIYEQQTDNSSHLIEGSEAALFVREMNKKGIRFESLRATEQQNKLNQILEYRKELETALKR
jgi:ABC-type Fe3+ transport system substrate-binding protein